MRAHEDTIHDQEDAYELQMQHLKEHFNGKEQRDMRQFKRKLVHIPETSLPEIDPGLHQKYPNLKKKNKATFLKKNEDGKGIRASTQLQEKFMSRLKRKDSI